MKFLSFTFLLILFITTDTCFSQVIITTTKPDSISNWTKKNTVGFDISEIAFVNWNAGGTSSISGLLKGDFYRTRTTDHSTWLNELIVRYGLNKQEGTELRKTEDAIKFNSTYGYRKDTLSNWYHSAKFNFATQFTDGYSYPNTDVAVSKAFAPAYIFLGIGAENSNKEKQRIFYISPCTFKTTLVLDQTLANLGSFGVKKAEYDSNGNLISEGEKSKTEFGFLITAYMKNEVFTNINLENRLSLYSDYLNNFGNIDVDWDSQAVLVVNQYVKANIGLHLIYDDDIKTSEEIDGITIVKGPKTQLKQVLGIGITYAF